MPTQLASVFTWIESTTNLVIMVPSMCFKTRLSYDKFLQLSSLFFKSFYESLYEVGMALSTPCKSSPVLTSGHSWCVA